MRSVYCHPSIPTTQGSQLLCGIESERRGGDALRIRNVTLPLHSLDIVTGDQGSELCRTISLQRGRKFEMNPVPTRLASVV